MPPWSPTLGRLLILLLYEVGVEFQPPKPPSPAPFDPAPFNDLLLLQVGVGERGVRISMARALGASAMGLDRPGGPPGRFGSGMGSPRGAMGIGLG